MISFPGAYSELYLENMYCKGFRALDIGKDDTLSLEECATIVRRECKRHHTLFVYNNRTEAACECIPHDCREPQCNCALDKSQDGRNIYAMDEGITILTLMSNKQS